MTVPDLAYQLTFNFTLNRVGTAQDVAEFSIWLLSDDAPPDWDSALLARAGAGNAAWKGHMPAADFTNAVTLTSVRATKYLANGHTEFEQIYVDPSPWHGTATGASLPWETSLACSLYTYQRGTFVSNGRRKRGRFYLPPMASSVLDTSNSGYYSNSDLSTLYAAVAQFLDFVNRDEAGVAVATVSVFSRADSVLRPVTWLAIDAKFDSQRRRENRETAAYLEGVWP